MTSIHSPANPLYKALLRLRNSSRERRERRVALIEGAHLVAAYLAAGGQPRSVVVSAEALSGDEISGLVRRAAPLAPTVLADTLMSRLSSVTTPPGIMAEIDIPATRRVPPDADFCIMLENIQDSGNVGSILRSAAAAGAAHALLSTGCADVWSPRVLRAAMGAHFLINIVERADLAVFASTYAGQVVAMAADAKRTIFETDLVQPTALIVGNEGAGISDALSAVARYRVSIPMPGGTESINVGAAVAVCCFERVRQAMKVRQRR